MTSQRQHTMWSSQPKETIKKNTLAQFGTPRDGKCSSRSPRCELEPDWLVGRLAIEEAACMLTLYPLDLFAGKKSCGLINNIVYLKSLYG